MKLNPAPTRAHTLRLITIRWLYVVLADHHCQKTGVIHDVPYSRDVNERRQRSQENILIDEHLLGLTKSGALQAICLRLRAIGGRDKRKYGALLRPAEASRCILLALWLAQQQTFGSVVW